MAITGPVSSFEDFYNSATPITSRTNTFDIGTRTDGMLRVCIGIYDIGGSDPDVSDVTWDGTSFGTEAVTLNGDPTAAIQCWIYYLTGPTDGSNDLVVSFDSNVQRVSIQADWWDGVEQTAPLDDVCSGAFDDVTDPTCTLVPTEDNELLTSYYGSDANITLTVGSGETAIQNVDQGGQTQGSSYDIQTTAASQAMNWTYASHPGDDPTVLVAASFKEAAAAADPEGPLVGGKLVGGGILKGRLVR